MNVERSVYCLRLDLKTVARRYAHPCKRIFHDGF
jgi:hypothetical protein